MPDVSNRELQREIRAQSGVCLRCEVSAGSCTTMAVGGAIAALAEPENEEDLSRLLKTASKMGIKPRVIGNGSNVVVSDDGLNELVIRLGRNFRQTPVVHSSGKLECGAGVSLMRLSQISAELGFSGLEFAGGIPATVGGAVCMNAGAHGAEMAQVLLAIKICTSDGVIVNLEPSDLSFSYRYSKIPEGAIVIGATFALTQSDVPSVKECRSNLLKERKARQPLQYASAGSVFKNPSSSTYAGALIDACGLKGHQEGGAQISLLHGNWIINPRREARAGEVFQLIDLCKRKVSERFSVDLALEFKLWGQF